MNKRSGILGLIPAKGKSTRLVRKNIIDFAGKSLLQLAIESCQEAGLCDEIIVSTEDSEIKETALNLGARVPFIRPEHLAVDPAGIVEVALHALDHIEKSENKFFKTLFIISPTCPLRAAADINAAYKMFQEQQGKFLMSVSEYSHSPYSAWTINDKGFSHPLFPDLCIKKSQELSKAYRCNGAIHILDIEAFKVKKSYTAEPLLSYVMPYERSIDVDTQEDMLEAEIYYRKSLLP